MKRVSDEPIEQETTVSKRPKIMRLDDDNRIKIAVKAALCKEGDEIISNKPIILNCAGEDACYNYDLAYWPYTEEIGEKLLNYLKTTLDEEDTVPHIMTVDTLFSIATEENYDDKDRLSDLDKIVGPDAINTIGRIAFIDKSNHVFEKVIEKPHIWWVKYDQLSPHLYQQECILSD